MIVLVGEIDAALRDEASASMAQALVAGSPVVIDSTLATFIDSAGLAFVLQLSRAASEAGIAVSLRDPHRVLRDVLDMIGLGGELPGLSPPGAGRPVVSVGWFTFAACGCCTRRTGTWAGRCTGSICSTTRRRTSRTWSTSCAPSRSTRWSSPGTCTTARSRPSRP